MANTLANVKNDKNKKPTNLSNAIIHRQRTRTMYDGTHLTEGEIDKLEKANGDGSVVYLTKVFFLSPSRPFSSYFTSS